jgi:hypothetical protein
MKKIVIFILIITFALPHFVLASWWNPVSWFNNWSFSGKTETKTEILEKRIRELENKLNTSTTTSIVTKFYTKYDNTRVRACASTTGCDVIWYYYYKNTEIILQGEITYKLNDLPEWLEHTTPNGLKGYINKSILSEKPIEIINPAETSKNPISETVSVQKNNQTSSKETALSLIDTWINNPVFELGEIDQYSKDIDYWKDRFQEIRESALFLMNNATDQYLISQAKYLLDICDVIITSSELAKNGMSDGNYTSSVQSFFKDTDSVQSLLKYVNEHIVELKDYRKKIPELYINEEVSKAELIKLISSNTSYKTNLIDKRYKAEKLYLAMVGEAISRKDQALSELKSYFSQNRVTNTIINTPIYQPMIIPQLQVPKTTNCTIGQMSGARGYYTVSCY